MGLNYKQILGSAGNDQLTAACEFVVYGFAGDDVITGVQGENQLLIGGAGNDIYRPTNNNLITVMDRDGGKDTVEASYLDFNNPQMWWAKIEGKHLFFVGPPSQGVLVLDAFTSGSAIETFKFASGTYSLADIQARMSAQNGPNTAFYYGDLTWEQARSYPGNYSKVDALEGWAYFASLHKNGPPSFSGPQHVANIALLYEAGLGRAADTAGLNYWIDEFEKGRPLVEMAAAFLESDEFNSRYGDDDAMSNQRFAEVMYTNVLGRAPDVGGLAFWTAELDRGANHEQILQAFAASPENVAGGNLGSLVEISSGVWAFG